MSILNFKHPSNIETLWEVILDGSNVRKISQENAIHIREIFINNINNFFESEKLNVKSLVELNKKYIMLIIQYINEKHNTNKIKIHNTQLDEPIRVDEIKLDKKNKFDIDLAKREQEFQDLLTVNKPPVPNFAEKIDEPLYNMGDKIKVLQQQRKYDIEVFATKNEQSSNVNYVQNTEQKKVSWDNNINIINKSEEIIESDNILSKLKIKPQLNIINENENELSSNHINNQAIFERIDSTLNTIVQSQIKMQNNISDILNKLVTQLEIINNTNNNLHK